MKAGKHMWRYNAKLVLNDSCTYKTVHTNLVQCYTVTLLIELRISKYPSVFLNRAEVHRKGDGTKS